MRSEVVEVCVGNKGPLHGVVRVEPPARLRQPKPVSKFNIPCHVPGKVHSDPRGSSPLPEKSGFRVDGVFAWSGEKKPEAHDPHGRRVRRCIPTGEGVLFPNRCDRHDD